jgi:exosortase D (VPLPA-CTERM-specific)
VGNLTQIPYFITYGLIIASAGLVLLVAGAKQGLRYWPAWVYLVFMLPLPNAMYWQVSTQLQFLSSQLGVELIRLASIPVLLEGNIIDLGEYKLQVAEACSGLRYLFPLASFGFLFAVLYRGPAWHKLVLFLSTLPITVIMNSFRIGVIGILVNSYGTEQAEGFLHWFEGWVIFAACLAVLYLEAAILQRFSKNPQSVLSLLDLRWDGFGEPLKRLVSLDASRPLLWASCLLILAGLAWHLTPKRTPPDLERKFFVEFPMTIGDWKGTFYKLDPVIEAALGADEYLSTSYEKPGADPISFFVSYYNSTTDGSGIHSPEICIPGGGWEVSRWQQIPVTVEHEGRTQNFYVNRAIIQKGEFRQVVYYWFEMRGHRFASEYAAKFNTVWESLTRYRADGALVRLVTPMEKGESESAADRRLLGFMGPMLKELESFIPE